MFGFSVLVSIRYFTEDGPEYKLPVPFTSLFP